ncbi:acyl-coenzyme A amino acid N-acyltransferase 1 isoform X2 [Xenopus laevis]|uniref:Acyl-coenzyme A amino acid N-acyltransferase 1 isoform X2 n=1 Tax=Xenopus laevis TaxID=8355 RepID=A0A8J1M4D4_XENLA|nr:acyl-coenzyme A amino acid N-acyltransferase 1 isoform X2 [Xenopus laevis]
MDMAGLSATPGVSLADEPVKIRAWGLPPQQLITIRAWLKDEKGAIFQSRAFYITTIEGEVDLEEASATGGDFQGVLPMGLLWSLKPTTPFLRLIKRDVMGSPFLIHLEVYPYLVVLPSPKDTPCAAQIIERWYVTPGVQRYNVREGRIRGTLFLPPGEGPFPGVIDMFGGFGGLMEFRSSLLASRGFASLALAYFAYDDLPKQLDVLELEYFEEAAQFLLRNPKVINHGVGVIGVSKGAEIALALACHLPMVKATVCINGTNAIYGFTLTYRDLCMRGIPYNSGRVEITDLGLLWSRRVIEETKESEHQDSILPLEKARGPVLFLVGEEDKSYNSLKFAMEALARAKGRGKNDVHLLSFPGTGHLIEPPGSPLCHVSQPARDSLPVWWGGELVAHCTAQETSWKEILSFLFAHVGISKQSNL